MPSGEPPLGRNWKTNHLNSLQATHSPTFFKILGVNRLGLAHDEQLLAT
jgi:hypothetical protein